MFGCSSWPGTARVPLRGPFLLPGRRFNARLGGKDNAVQPSLLTRIRWRLEELRHVDDAKLIGGLVLALTLTFGGFLAARAATRASAGSASVTQMVTLRQKVRVREHGHIVTRWRIRHLYARGQTVMRTQTISTPNGIRLVTHRITRDRMVYRNRPAAPAKTVVVSRQVTDVRTVTATQQLTVVETTTAISTVTDTLPITVTVP